MTSMRLWAKSWNEAESGPAPPSVFLPGHLDEVLNAADRLLDHTALTQIHAFGLDSSVWLERFRRTVRLAAAVHDIGKANNHFQGMVTRDRARIGKSQGLRHEWVTWYILQKPEVREWLLPALEDNSREDDWLVMLWAVTGHHPAFGRPSPPKSVPHNAGSEIELLLANEEFQFCLNWLNKTFFPGNAQVPVLANETASLSQLIKKIATSEQQSAQKWDGWSRLTCHVGMLGYVAAVKNCLVAADVAGSALPHLGLCIARQQSWIATAFERRPGKTEFDSIITDRLTDPITGNVHELLPFQRDMAAGTQDITFVKAGCGSGKTLGAYHWARERFPNRQLFLCYPTTGTATEGFRDYLFDADSQTTKAHARLFHGRAEIDLRLILGINDQESDDHDTLIRIESLDIWSTPVVICTVDTVLGIMQNNRRGLYAWPAIAGGAFVFDEIHSYDPGLFGTLLRFISELRTIPVLLMTASLPEFRLRKLKKAVDARKGNSPLVTIDGPRELECIPRYHRRRVTSEEELYSLIHQELHRTDRAGKVLWVCNTVKRAIAAALKCRSDGMSPLVYHSRFRYEDRLNRHAEVIDTFQASELPALAICTQVSEMSLDLSATLLVTELAPISSLIQRLGRLNRRARTRGTPTMPFVVTRDYQDDQQASPLPYTQNDLDLAGTWLAHLPDVISQKDLIDTWTLVTDPSTAEQLSTDSHWLDGGSKREVKELRQGSPGISVVLKSDLEALKSDEPNTRKTLLQVLLPMPSPPGSFNWKTGPHYHGAPIVDDSLIQYDVNLGADWR